MRKGFLILKQNWGKVPNFVFKLGKTHRGGRGTCFTLHFSVANSHFSRSKRHSKELGSICTRRGLVGL